MTDDPIDRPTDDASDDATQQAVTRLLAEVRHTAPMPPEVAARLDGVLADLAASSPAPATDTAPRRSAAVVPIASRQRRRFATALVAAAAVVAVGVALPNLTGGLGGSADQAASDSDSAGTAAESGDQMMREESAPDDAPPSESEPSAPESELGGTAETSAAPPTVSPESFQQDVRRARPQATALSAATGPVCGVLPPGEVVPVLYEGRTGYLVFIDGGRARERVELYGCPEGDLLRQGRIPAP